MELPHAPIGYEETMAMFKRDMDFWGVIRSFSFPMGFVLAGGIRLKELLLGKGVDFIASLRIDKLNRSTLKYDTMYEGELDLSKTTCHKTKIEIPLMDGDLQAKIKAYQNTKYEFNMDQYVEVNLLGTDFVDYANLNLAASMNKNTSKIAGVNISSSDLTLDKIDVFSPSEQAYTNENGNQAPNNIYIVNFVISPNYAILANQNVRVNIKGTINCNFLNYLESRLFNYTVRLVDSTDPRGGNIVNLVTTRDYAPNTQYNNEVLNIDSEVDLVQGRKYFITIHSVGMANAETMASQNFSINESTLKVSYAGTSTNVNVKAVKPSILFTKIINAIRPNTEAVSSILEDTQVLITSGDAIRGIIDPKIKTSFSDFYKSMNAVHCVGYSSHKNKAVLEGRDFFFRNTNQLAVLDDIKDLTYTPMTDIMYSNILVGYPDETYDNERGREEFNQGQNWVTPSYRVQNTLDIQSTYRADQFGIDELIKKQLQGNTDNDTNTDASGDNDVFMLWVKKVPVNGVYQLVTGADFTSISGVSDRTYTYNIDLSPKRNLMRHMDFIKSSFWGVNEDGYISLASADKNADISSTKDGVTERERDPIYIKDYQKRVLIPFLVTFKTDYNKDIMDAINLTPEGYIKFKWNNSYFSGYIYEIKIDVSKNSEQEFTVMLSKDNNISKLI